MYGSPALLVWKPNSIIHSCSRVNSHTLEW